MLQRCFEALRPARPMVHCITNSVTINDCANVLLAAGARPIMADDPEESAEITAACRALVLNLGMLSPRKLEAMVKSGHQANRMGIPVVLDPVGAGASALRTRAAYTLLEEVRFAAVRGNGSEIRVLAASPEQPFAAVCTAVCAMKTAGELARAALAPDEGSGSYRVRLIDAVNRLDGPTLAARAQWEEL